ncbi:MAG: hypothetical protein ACE5GN_04210, partial [Waddliaceae bacterium]
MVVVENFQRGNKNLESSSPSLESFEETYKTAYSHGLEDIYSIKNVDLKTVKRIQESEPEVLALPEEVTTFDVDDSFSDGQLEMDLGDTFRGWIEPFLLREPIQVLGLTHHAELCLIEHEMLFLQDLIGRDLREFVFLKGMGQGYIDEIQKRMKAYIGNQSLERSFRIEFGSWMKSIFAGLDRKKAAVFLHSYGLEGLILLSKAERTEVKHTDSKAKDKWAKEFYVELRAEGRLAQVHEDMSRIVNIFIIPWMRNRLHKATTNELIERMERVSDSKERTSHIIRFFSDVYYDKQFPLAKYLYTIEEDIYGCDEGYVTAY